MKLGRCFSNQSFNDGCCSPMAFMPFYTNEWKIALNQREVYEIEYNWENAEFAYQYKSWYGNTVISHLNAFFFSIILCISQLRVFEEKKLCHLYGFIVKEGIFSFTATQTKAQKTKIVFILVRNSWKIQTPFVFQNFGNSNLYHFTKVILWTRVKRRYVNEFCQLNFIIILHNWC